MTDLFGVTLNVGDRIVYTTGSQGNQFLEIGTIYSIDPSHFRNDVPGALITTSTGRKATRWRGSISLVSIEPIAEYRPELFI